MTSDYLTFFTDLAKYSPQTIVSLFFLALFRIVPIVAVAPFLGAKLVPPIGKMALAICLSIIFLPFLFSHVSHEILFNDAYIGYAAKELLVGFVIGVLVAIPFYVVESSGIYIDYQRGASSMQSQDPILQMQASPIGIFFNYILIIMFFQLNGPFIFFDGLLNSYTVFPPDAYLNAAFFEYGNPFWQSIMGLLSTIVTIAIQLAAPSLVAILMAEMFLGIANRLAPQVQIAFLGMSLKSFLGLSLLWAGWFFILRQMGKYSLEWLENMNSLFQGLQNFALK